MSGGINYDESGALASYFGISFLTLILVPTTAIAIKRSLFTQTKKGKECTCSQCQEKVRRIKGFHTEGGTWFSLRNVLLLAGWTAFFGLAYIIANSESVEMKVYDPFEILGLSSSSDEKAIKKHYKKISLKFHPDKIKTTVNQTKEQAESYFVELTKAYKSLTDETIRENLQKYGNPDGQQPREEKIAIPKWIVEGHNGLWVLALYGIGLGGGIPFVVGRWWFKQRVLTKDGALSTTAELFFHNLTDDISLPALIALIASAFEIKAILSANSTSKKQKRTRQAQTEELEKRVKAECIKLEIWDGDVLAQGWEGKGNGVVVMNAHNRRAAALIWSHLLRIEDLDVDVLDERRQVLLQIPKFIPSLINVSVAYHWLNTTLSCMNVYPQLVQATPYSDTPALQLPGVDSEQAKTLLKGYIEGPGWQEKVWTSDSAKELVGEQGVKVAKQMPTLHVTDAKFQVEGETSITVGALCQLHYTVHLTAEEPPAEVVQASLRNQKIKKKEDKEEIFAHAPYWPAHRKPHWWVMVADGTSGTVLFPPQRIGDIPLLASDAAVVDIQQDKDDGKSDKQAKGATFKLSFPAPPTPGSTTVEVYWISDTYIGGNIVKPLVLTVLAEESGEEEDEDDGISEPEEDTIAGQIAMLRGQKVKRVEDRGEDDEVDDESESEGESERDSDSDSDSDTDEGNNNKAKGKGGKKVVVDSDSDSD